MDGISIVGGCAISDGSQAHRPSEQRLECEQLIRLTLSPCGLMGFVLYLHLHAHTNPAEEDIIVNLTLF